MARKQPVRAKTTILRNKYDKIKKKEDKKLNKQATTRLMLYYADEHIEKSMRVKNQIRHIKPRQGGSSCEIQFDNLLYNEKFKQSLRETEGLFFDFISPHSPPKIMESNYTLYPDITELQ